MPKKPVQTPFDFHCLWTYESNGKERIAQCHECGKEDKLYINAETYQWECKYCGEKGNQYTFMKQLVDYSMQETSDEDYQELAEDRGIDAEILKRHRLCKSWLNEEWLVPIFNESGGMNNLLTWRSNGSKKLLMGTPGIGQSLYLRDQYDDNKETTFLVEGHWDALAWDQILIAEGIRDKYNILGAPGSNSFRVEWLKYLTPITYIIYDNDKPKKQGNRIIQPGKDGTNRIIEMLEQHENRVIELYVADWKASDPKDIRDWLNA